jgi:hypothetical protein
MIGIDKSRHDLRLLLRELRSLEQNKRDRIEESQAKVQKQRRIIEKSMQENEYLKNEILRLVKVSKQNNLLPSQQQILHEIHEAGDKFTVLIMTEKETIENLQLQINEMREKLFHFQKQIGGCFASRNNDELVHKQIKILEHRLEKATAKFNRIVAENKSLRNTIDELRKEQQVYDKLEFKIEEETKMNKQLMAELVDTSNIAHEQRDAYLLEISAIEQTERAEKDDYQKRMNEMCNLIDNEYKINPSMAIRKSASSSQLRLLTSTTDVPDLDRRKYLSKEGLLLLKQSPNHASSVVERPNSSSNTSQMVARRQSKQITDNTTRIDDSVLKFERAFERIRTSTGFSNVDELVRNYVKNEQSNQNLFRYVSEQEIEVEKIRSKLNSLRIEDEKLKQCQGVYYNEQQLLFNMTQELFQVNNMKSKFEKKNEILNNIILNSYNNINDLLESIINNCHENKFEIDEELKTENSEFNVDKNKQDCLDSSLKSIIQIDHSNISYLSEETIKEKLSKLETELTLFLNIQAERRRDGLNEMSDTSKFNAIDNDIDVSNSSNLPSNEKECKEKGSTVMDISIPNHIAEEQKKDENNMKIESSIFIEDLVDSTPEIPRATSGITTKSEITIETSPEKPKKAAQQSSKVTKVFDSDKSLIRKTPIIQTKGMPIQEVKSKTGSLLKKGYRRPEIPPRVDIVSLQT